jgi:RNA polymerase sigma-70 factor (ECF subfamily)
MLDDEPQAGTGAEDTSLPDDRLRLVFTCCHPALAPMTQVGLTLRLICGLQTTEIARAFLVPSDLAQRIVRAKRQLHDNHAPPHPRAAELPDRLDAVLNAIALIFTEPQPSSETARTGGLTTEAIRLARVLVDHARRAGAVGLLALLVL